MTSSATLSVNTYIDLLHLTDGDRLRALEKIGKDFLAKQAVNATDDKSSSDPCSN